MFGDNQQQMPVPTAVTSHNKKRNVIPEPALARGASARRVASFAMPIVDVYASAFEEVQRMSTIWTGVFLYQAAQEITALLLDRRKILALSRQQFRILHRCSPQRTAESLSLSLQSVTERSPDSLSPAGRLAEAISLAEQSRSSLISVASPLSSEAPVARDSDRRLRDTGLLSIDPEGQLIRVIIRK